MKRMVYADNAATTQLDIEAFEAMKPFLLMEYGNASQPYSFSRTAKRALKESRETIANCIGASPEEIYFTSGGTESDNWVIKGSAFSDPLKRATITSSIEHHAILHACADIERLGYPVAYLPVNTRGEVSHKTLDEWITNKTRLVSIMFANNEIGTIQDIKTLCDISHSKGALFHTDAVQAVGHMHIDVKKLGIDMLSASAHKFNGPKGVGFLYIKSGTAITSYISGGKQEFGMRAGTENVASIVGMAIALKNNLNHLDANIAHIGKLEQQLIDGLHDRKIQFVRNGSNLRIPGNISLSFNDYEGEALLHRLDLMGISVSTGSACNSEITQVSHVLQGIGLNDRLAKGTIRISLGKNNTEEDIATILSALSKIIK